LLTILKIVAGTAVLGIVAMLLIAVLSGLMASARALKRGQDEHRPH
jgi:hypothetical protein